jgi:CRISPR system Cascade subunit CasE
MSGGLFLSRIRLRRDGSVLALARLLVPDGEAAIRHAAGHNLLWSLFADGPDRQRDFLWREERSGQFLVLSSREPTDRHGLFTIESKPFEPRLAAGDRLRFSLRANPVVSRSSASGIRGARHDVIMDALRHVPREDRAAQRLSITLKAGRAWLTKQGERFGFVLDPDVAVDGYESVRLPRPGGARPVIFGMADFDGVLTVSDPGAFLARIPVGFGRARAFGCGLMLIRRAR